MRKCPYDSNGQKEVKLLSTEERILNQLRPALISTIKTFGNQMDLGNDFIRFRYLDETFELKVRKVKPRKNGKGNKI